MHLRKAYLFAAAAVATVALAGTASAQEIKPSISFNAGASNNYMFRGVSQTNGDASVFAGADVSAGPVYFGTWASNVDFGDSTDIEVDLYGGFKPTLGPVSLDLGVIYYTYPGDPKGSGYSNLEFKAAGSVAAGPGSLGVAVYYSTDGFGAADDSTYYEVNGSFPLAEKISLSGALGRQAYKGSGDYTTWNVGANWAVAHNLSLDLRYIDNDAHSFGKAYHGAGVLTLKATFP